MLTFPIIIDNTVNLNDTLYICLLQIILVNINFHICKSQNFLALSFCFIKEETEDQTH